MSKTHTAFTLVLALLAIWSTRAGAIQDAASARFDAASVKRNTDPDGPRYFDTPSPGRVRLINQTVRQLIGSSYQLQDYQIVGAPDWLQDERYDVEARAEGSPPPPQLLAMVRGLLADRFQLSTHRETRDLPVYRLVYARADRRAGPQLTPSTCRPATAPQAADQDRASVPCGNQVARTRMTLRGTTMRGLAAQLGRLPFMGRPVIDATGDSGVVDIELTWADAGATAPDRIDAPAMAGAVVTALEEQLGLKLESARSPVDVLVIDRVARPSAD